jgi:uncharacterized protein with PIN domain
MGRISLNDNTPDEDAGPRFLVDRTAGRLSRWLRILGLDVEYIATCDSASIARLARQTGRKALTRSSDLAGRLRADAILLESENVHEQVRQVVALVGRGACKPFSRCSLCNVKLRAVGKPDVKGRIPEYVFATQDRFSTCPACGRYYWHGTHWDRMSEEIEQILGMNQAEANGGTERAEG